MALVDAVECVAGIHYCFDTVFMVVGSIWWFVVVNADQITEPQM
jgi:hypothetical protein